MECVASVERCRCLERAARWSALNATSPAIFYSADLQEAGLLHAAKHTKPDDINNDSQYRSLLITPVISPC